MRTRFGYVSNSSSSSFLVPREYNAGGVESIKLPEEIWKAIWRNHVEWDGKKLDLSVSDEWWLTNMVSDCIDQYGEIAESPNAIPYLEGNECPYGYYDRESDYIVFRRNDEHFYVLVSDFVDVNGRTEIPDVVRLRDGARKVLESKDLNKTQKLEALKCLFDF